MLSDSQKTDITNYVNSYRAKNQAPPLSWDDNIYGTSQSWSGNLESQHLMQHSGNSAYGENLAFFQGYGTEPIALIKKAIDAWYAEIALYDFSKLGFGESTGHFTCLVWVASTRFAIGISVSSANNEAYIVMNTSPPGNYIGQFAQNVLPLTPGTQTSPTGSNVAVPLAPKLQTHKRILFQKLYNIVYAVGSNQPKSVIVGIVNSIIHDINSYADF